MNESINQSAHVFYLSKEKFNTLCDTKTRRDMTCTVLKAT